MFKDNTKTIQTNRLILRKLALCQELGLTKNNKDADAVKGKLALDCIVAFKRLEKT